MRRIRNHAVTAASLILVANLVLTGLGAPAPVLAQQPVPGEGELANVPREVEFEGERYLFDRMVNISVRSTGLVQVGRTDSLRLFAASEQGPFDRIFGLVRPRPESGLARYLPEVPANGGQCPAETSGLGPLTLENLTYAPAGLETDLRPNRLDQVGQAGDLPLFAENTAQPFAEVFVQTADGFQRFILLDDQGLPPQLAGTVPFGGQELTFVDNATGQVDPSTLSRIGCAAAFPIAAVAGSQAPFTELYAIVGDQILRFAATEVQASPVPVEETPTEPGIVPVGTEPVETDTPTAVPTETPTETPTATPTETPIPPTDTPTETPVPPTETPSETPVPPTDTPTPTETPTAVPTETPTAMSTETPAATATVPPTVTTAPTETATTVATATPTPRVVATQTASPTATSTPVSVTAPSPTSTLAAAQATATPTSTAAGVQATVILGPGQVPTAVPPSPCPGDVGPLGPDGRPLRLPVAIGIRGQTFVFTGVADLAQEGALTRVGCAGPYQVVTSSASDSQDVQFLYLAAPPEPGAPVLFRYEAVPSYNVQFEVAGSAQVITDGNQQYVVQEPWPRIVYGSLDVILYAEDPSQPTPDRIFARSVTSGVFGEYVPAQSGESSAAVTPQPGSGINADLTIGDTRYLLAAIWTVVGSTADGWVTLHSTTTEGAPDMLLGVDPRVPELLVYRRSGA